MRANPRSCANEDQLVITLLIVLFGLALSIILLLLGGYRMKNGQIVTVTPFLFPLFRQAKQTYCDRGKGGLSIEQEEEELRRWYHFMAAAPPAMVALSFFTN